MIYFHSFKSPGLILDIVGDIRALNELARTSVKAGMVILGGGVCKHQIANAMLIVRFVFLSEWSFLTSDVA
jgi:deoxyhypusine synthase